jgi:hypothetical protein
MLLLQKWREFIGLSYNVNFNGYREEMYRQVYSLKCLNFSVKDKSTYYSILWRRYEGKKISLGVAWEYIRSNYILLI